MAEAKTERIKAKDDGLGKGIYLDNNCSSFSPYHKLAKQLDDAERLLVYAAETGRKIAPNIHEAVLNARNVSTDKWDKQTVVGVLSALTSLSHELHPVTAASLKICAVEKIADKTMRGYKRFAMFLTPIILLFSLVTFITSGISKAIETGVIAPFPPSYAANGRC
jgi:hypothetical protein